MNSLKVRLFGRFSLQKSGHELGCVQSAKAKELLCYLLLHRDRVHSREVLASILWGDCDTQQSRKYFRQTLWQLQQGLREASLNGQVRVLPVSGESLCLKLQSDLWLDVSVFENAFASVQGFTGERMDPRQAERLRESVSLYVGDLLEGWYQDWCLYHRERLQNIYLALMDKLMGYCEFHRDYETGLELGERLLGLDRGRERTYFAMMRLHYLSGDRAGAIRQFRRCTAALEEELGVKPARRTIELYEQIRADELRAPSPAQIESSGPPGEQVLLASRLPSLRKLRTALVKVHCRLRRDIRELDQVLAEHLDQQQTPRP